MIQSLAISNVALIEKLQISFHDGLHVLSGETGAGKSIVVDAVNLVLGSRADRDLIRTGAEKAAVEACFDVPENAEIQGLMNRESIDYDGRTVTVYRELGQNGRNICRICGVMMPLGFLRELAPMLMDIHGQHDHRFLLDPKMHLTFLDSLGDAAHRQLTEKTAECCRLFLANHRAYAKLVKQNETREARMAEVEKELERLTKARLKPGEENQLEEERRLLRDAEKITGGLHAACDALSAGEEEAAAQDSLRSAMSALIGLAAYGEEYQALAARAESLYYETEELAFDVQRLLSRFPDDPDRLERIEKRLELIRRLKRRYGESEEEILAARKALEEEYNDLSTLEDRIREMGAEHKRLLAAYRQAAKQLTASRHRLAESFEERMHRELSDLGMENTVFRVCFEETEQEKGKKPRMPREIGDDEVEFMISPNPGEPIKPLARIASGGELSRLMLAIKTLEAGHSGIQAMVFDEIDTGISGRMAQVVAEKMITISRTCQVICVTHLPQIAAAADHEYRVEKSVSGERTHTRVTELDEAGRVEEVARMISGAEGITAESTEYARRMLEASRKMKRG